MLKLRASIIERTGSETLGLTIWYKSWIQSVTFAGSTVATYRTYALRIRFWQ